MLLETQHRFCRGFLFYIDMNLKEKELEFLEKFNEKLSHKFKLVAFNYEERFNQKIKLVCKECEFIKEIGFYNVLNAKGCKRCTGKKIANKRHEDKWVDKLEFEKQLPKERNYKILEEKINLNHRVLVEDYFGVCKVSPKALLKGSLPTVAQALDKDSYRINLYRSIHGDNFSYPDYKYITNNSTINIVCNRCGLEDTVIDCNHIKIKSGCKNCDTKLGAPLMPNDEFIKRVEDTGSGIEVLENRKGYHTPILCRNKYGLVKVSPHHLLKGGIGSLRTAVDKTSYMIEQFKEKHNNFYSYPNYNYCGNRCLGKIECPIHGEFEQLTDVHLMGSGCTSCSFLDGDRNNGYSRSGFISKAKGRECTLYLVRMFNDTEDFYKIGITSRSTEHRIKKSTDIKYNFEIIYEYKSFDAGYIWDLEKRYHREYKHYHYLPKIYFKGVSECFLSDLPTEEFIQNLSK